MPIFPGASGATFSRRIGVPLAVALVTASANGAGLPWEVWESPSRLAVVSADDSVLERSSHCPDGCRFDRSNPGDEGSAANPYPLRWLYRDGDEAILLDEPGPGALTRLWLTTGFGVSTCIDPAIRVHLHVDDAIAPTLDLPLAALFDGSTPPFTPPLVADTSQASGGYVSRVPIAYAHRLRVALTGVDATTINPCTGTTQRLLWFQLQHHRLVPGTPVTGFVAAHDEPGWRAFLAHAGDDPWNAMLAPQVAATTLAPGAVVALASRAGPGWLRGIRLRVPRAAYDAVTLRVRIDGALAVDAPLADYFASPRDAQQAARGVLVGEDAGGWLYAWFPMPFALAAEVELVAAATLPSPLAIDSALTFDAQPIPPGTGRFHARLASACSASMPFLLADANGAGRVVGIAARWRADGVTSRGYLEGDERAMVDGSPTPAWYGTGVEDLHDGGFYFDRGAYAGPLAGATLVDADGNGSTAAYRLLPTDPITHASALRLVQESGYAPAMPVPACLRSVVYAYHRDAPLLVSHDAFELGDAADAAAHVYAGAGAACAVLTAQFEDEPPTTRSALACSRASGVSSFRFRTADAQASLRLRRTYDAGAGTAGATAGSAGATIFVNGVEAGAFAPARANPQRRWQQQEALLDVPPGTTELEFSIVPATSPQAPLFAESRWELRGDWKDGVFTDGFDAAGGASRRDRAAR